MAAWWKLQTKAGGKKDDKVQFKHQGWAVILVPIHSQEYRLPVPEVVNFQGRAETSTLEGRWREQGGRRLLSKEITNIKGIFWSQLIFFGSSWEKQRGIPFPKNWELSSWSRSQKRKTILNSDSGSWIGRAIPVPIAGIQKSIPAHPCC